MPGIRGIGRVCRIYTRTLYRPLGAEHIRHRRDASPEVLMRRLLSLDYVIEHAELPWLATESEKVAAFDSLGIERGLLPVRVYRGAATAARRYFPRQAPCRAGFGPRRLPLRRSRPQDRDRAAVLGRVAPRTLVRAPEAGPVRRGRGSRSHHQGA